MDDDKLNKIAELKDKIKELEKNTTDSFNIVTASFIACSLAMWLHQINHWIS
jgi:hypothetical protein